MSGDAGLHTVLRRLVQLMERAERTPIAEMLPVLLNIWLACDALIQTADITMATMPLAAAMDDR